MSAERVVDHFECRVEALVNEIGVPNPDSCVSVDHLGLDPSRMSIDVSVAQLWWQSDHQLSIGAAVSEVGPLELVVGVRLNSLPQHCRHVVGLGHGIEVQIDCTHFESEVINQNDERNQLLVAHLCCQCDGINTCIDVRSSASQTLDEEQQVWQTADDKLAKCWPQISRLLHSTIIFSLFV